MHSTRAYDFPELTKAEQNEVGSRGWPVERNVRYVVSNRSGEWKLVRWEYARGLRAYVQ